MATTAAHPQTRAGADTMPLLGIDHLELYVGNAVQFSYWLTHALGFREIAFAGLETGVRDRSSHVLEQGAVRLVVTSSLHGRSEIARHVADHGDGVKVVAIRVPDAEYAYREAVRHGARGIREPWTESDDHGDIRLSQIATYGETIHTFVERDSYAGAFLPGYIALNDGDTGPGPLLHARDADAGAGFLTDIDHVVGNVELGRMEEWVSYYERVFGMTEMIHFSDEDISTEYSALMSKVVADGEGRIKFPINEPAEGKRRSQIEEYLEYYGGPGVQHVALTTPDIVATVRAFRERGVRFLNTPESYYDDLTDRVEQVAAQHDDLRELGILADRDDEGYLLQIFTKPIGDRPTLFLELIERHGAKGFGDGNFKALFEAIEREQAARGNL
jgi:4-hydroxyphenylpyruvate dioxygenase